MKKEQWMKWLDVLVVPVAVGIAGAVVAVATSSAQLESSKKIADAQIAAAKDNQNQQNNFQVTKAVIELLEKKIDCKAVVSDSSFYIEMATPEHARGLVELVEKRCGKFPETAEPVKAAQRNQIDRTLRALTGEGRRVARNALGELLSNVPRQVYPLMTNALKQNPGYRVQLGILIALNRAGYCLGKFTGLDDEIHKITDTDKTIRKNLKEIKNRKCGS